MRTPLTAVVTGANRGLGFALAERLASIGVCVLLTCRTGGAACNEAVSRLAASGLTGIEAYEAPLDVSDPSSRSTFVEYCTRRGGVDILVNNAAVCMTGWSPEVVRSTFRTNVIGPTALARDLLPGMLQRRRGYVINISSGDGELVYLQSALQAELRAMPDEAALLRLLARLSPPRDAYGAAPAHGPTPAYSVSKAALNTATRLQEQRLRQSTSGGVWVGAVCPGDVLTRMCTDRDAATTAEAAAADVLWLLETQIRDGGATLPSGRFWRARAQIEP